MEAAANVISGLYSISFSDGLREDQTCLLKQPLILFDAIEKIDKIKLSVRIIIFAIQFAHKVICRHGFSSGCFAKGQGLSNIIGSFFSSYASSGSFTRTGVNYESGAQTPLAAAFAAITLTGVLLLIAPLTAYLPIAAMAGILFLVAYSLVDTHHIVSIVRTSKPEAAILIATFLATLFVELEFAIYVGVLLSLLLYLNRTSHPTFVTLAPDPDSKRKTFINVRKKPLNECPQLKIIRIDGSLFFGAVNHVVELLDQITKKYPEQAHILIVGSGINFIDVAGCQTLNQEAHRLRVNGRQLYLCSLKGEVIDVMQRGGCSKNIGEENVFYSKNAAIRRIVPRLDPERCRPCKVRIFHECAQMPGA